MRLNTEFLMLIIFTHFMVDYVFQTSKISVNKAKSFRGVVIHEIIVLLVSTIVLSVYGLIGFLVAMIISISHFVIDYFKMKTRKYFRFGTTNYLIDQIIHFAVIVACGYWFGSIVREPIIKINHVGVVNYAIIITFIATIIAKLILADIYGSSLMAHGFFIKYERLFDFSIILFVSLMFFNTLMGLIALVIATVAFYYVESRCYKYSKIQVVIKLGIYLIIASVFRFLMNY